MVSRRANTGEFGREEGGATAVEFALIVPALCALVIGAFNLCLMVYTETSLHFATETAARYATTYTNTYGSAPSSSTIQTYAATKYKGVSATPTFTYTSQTCGNQVVASVSYSFNLGLTTIPVALSAKACRAT